MNNNFEVVYQSLSSPETRLEAAQYVARATAAMVSSRYFKNAPAATLLSRQGDGFVARSSSREALEALPRSYGSALGHFGIFERGEVVAIGCEEQCRVVYLIVEPFDTYAESTKRRLSREVGKRLAAYVGDRQLPVAVRSNEGTASIVCASGNADVLNALPLRFNAVFQRSAVMLLR